MLKSSLRNSSRNIAVETVSSRIGKQYTFCFFNSWWSFCARSRWAAACDAKSNIASFSLFSSSAEAYFAVSMLVVKVYFIRRSWGKLPCSWATDDCNDFRNVVIPTLTPMWLVIWSKVSFFTSNNSRHKYNKLDWVASVKSSKSLKVSYWGLQKWRYL